MSVNKITIVSGNFNILHPGHLRLLKFAKDLGNKLVVCVYSDKLTNYKTHIHESMRLEALKHSSFVDEAILIDQDINEIMLLDF
jgi:cytidyltransferase-like protein